MSDDYGDPNRSRRRFLALAGASAVGVAGCSSIDGLDGGAQPTPETVLELPHSVAVGDVTPETAVFWSRLDGDGVVHVEYASDDSFDSSTHRETTVDPDADNTAQIRLADLDPGTRYQYRAWATPDSEEGAGNAPVGSERLEEGTFVTAPASDESSSLTLVWSGDTYGYGGNPVEPPFESLASIADLGPDAFLYLGDTIYADASTPAGRVSQTTPPDEARETYREKYKEMRSPRGWVAETSHLPAALTATSVYATWDDHEVENNFYRSHPLMEVGLDVFFEYWPIDGHGSVTGDDDSRIYRTFRWGEHAEIFVLDTRQYKIPLDEDVESRSMLGRAQLDWLTESLRSSDATVKIVASSVTFGILSGDGWTEKGPTDYRRERDEILDVVSSESIENVVVLSADIHKAQVVTLGLDPNSEVDVVEASAGPMGAPAGAPNGYDRSLDPEPHYERGNDFRNFGVLRIDEDGEAFEIRIHAEDGTEEFSKSFPAT